MRCPECIFSFVTSTSCLFLSMERTLESLFEVNILNSFSHQALETPLVSLKLGSLQRGRHKCSIDGLQQEKTPLLFQFWLQGLQIAHIPTATATGNALQTYRGSCPASYAFLT